MVKVDFISHKLRSLSWPWAKVRAAYRLIFQAETSSRPSVVRDSCLIFERDDRCFVIYLRYVLKTWRFCAKCAKACLNRVSVMSNSAVPSCLLSFWDSVLSGEFLSLQLCSHWTNLLVSQIEVLLLPDDHRGHVVVQRWSRGRHGRIHTQAIAQIRAHWVSLIWFFTCAWPVDYHQESSEWFLLLSLPTHQVSMLRDTWKSIRSNLAQVKVLEEFLFKILKYPKYSWTFSALNRFESDTCASCMKDSVSRESF